MALITDKFTETYNGANPTSTTVASGRTAGVTTLACANLAGWPTNTAVHFATYKIDANSKKVAGSQVDWKGIVSGSNIGSLTVENGTDAGNAIGDIVEMMPTAMWAQDVVKALQKEHNQVDGSHSAITASSVVATGNITAANFIQSGGAGASGWTVGLATPNSVTALGNHSYSCVFNATDLTGTVSNGMRLRFTRTVAAPTQCTSLNGTTQYYSKSSPSGISFTGTFTCSAWVKLSSYAEGGIIARRNADTEGWSFFVNSSGQLSMNGLSTVGNNKAILSYQSLPLNKWVHVAATIDMSVAAATCGTMYIDGVSVPYAGTLTGAATSLVQGTTALVVGAEKSAGTFPFPGKIAQAAVFNAVLSQATILSYMSQTLTGSETSLISAYSFNNSINDLNANANNLTANGSAVATNADSPFAQGATAGSLEYGIITAASFSTNTTLTVQVPEGSAIPTSGGVSAVSYSSQKIPYGFPGQRDKWVIEFLNKGSMAVVSPVTGTWYVPNTNSTQVSIPIGAWDLGYKAVSNAVGSGGPTDMYSSLSTANNAETDARYTTRLYSSSTSLIIWSEQQGSYPVTLSAATTYYLIMKTGSTTSTMGWAGDNGATTIEAYNAYL